MTALHMRPLARDLPGTGSEARRAIRSGAFRGQTAGVAPGYVQGNLAILPQAVAPDFLRFCHLNPKPCPLLAASSRATLLCPRLLTTSISAPISRAIACSGAAC